MDSTEIVRQQLALYGEAWAPRLRRLLQTYRIPQVRLAQVLGLSAPMLSQLINGQRVKVANPAVFARIVRLEELAAGVAGDPAAAVSALDEVASAQPRLSTTTVSRQRDDLIDMLAGFAGDDLRRAAAAVGGTLLGEVLAAAATAGRDRGPR